MQFHKTDRPAPYLNRRDQRRMLLMVGMLVVVIIGVEFASRPESWYWLTGPPTPQNGETTPQPEGGDIDARLDRTPLPPGGFRLVQMVPEDQPQSDPPEANNDPTTIDPVIFKNVRDNSLGVRNNERGAYFKILAIARDLPEEQLQQAALRGVTFAQMFTDPEDYRGKLVTISGNVKRLMAVPAGQNDFGIKTIYEAWILTTDSGTNPLVLHFTDLPEGIPQGEQVDLSCRFTGYFFKKYAYEAGHGPHSTTMLLGKRLEWIQPAKISADGSLAPYILGLVLIVGAVTIFALWIYAASDRRFRRSHLDRILQASHGAIEEPAIEPTTDEPFPSNGDERAGLS